MCGLGQPHGAGRDLATPRPFAGDDQSQRDDAGEHDARARSEPALLDRIADQEKAAERQRDAAGPHHPLRAEALFEADPSRHRPGRGGRRCGLLGLNRRRRLGLGRERLLLFHRLGNDCSDRRGRRRLVAKRRELPFESGDAQLELLEAFPRAHRHDETDDRQHRDGENGRDDPGERVHHDKKIPQTRAGAAASRGWNGMWKVKRLNEANRSAPSSWWWPSPICLDLSGRPI